MPTSIPTSLRERREAIVSEHMQAEAVKYNPAATVATFRRPYCEVPALNAVFDGAEAVLGFVTNIVSAFPDFTIRPVVLYHADGAVIVEVRFRGTQRDVWAGIQPTGKKIDVQVALIFVFEDADLVGEKIYFDQATVMRQLGVIT